MLGSLSESQVEGLLHEESVGRIGCHSGGRTYVVPVAYIYDGTAVYAHSAEGLKLAMMRDNPEVCFEVDQIDSLHSWRSVIAWGWFEELHGKAAVGALELLLERFGRTDHEPDKGRLPSIALYRVVLDEKNGRFEEP